mmetsp:Transcript_18400/g.27587  ORF Transcript_18400/g.27587 Transcript_18400/m.27587 type:complete len:299 (-) Transcript_18400:53-949(-)
MPIMTEQTTRVDGPSTSPVVHELWPKLNNNKKETVGEDSKESSVHEEDEDWEYISSDSSHTSCTNDVKKMTKASTSETKEGEEMEELKEHSLIHRCESTPELSSFSSFTSIQASDDELSFVLDCGSSIDAQSIKTVQDDTVLLSHKKGSSTMKKVPSFKDMILMNAKKIEEEDQKKKAQLKELEEKRRKEAIQRRKTTRTRLIVTPIKRCAKSTGDLRSLVIHEDEEGYGGGSSAGVIHEEDEEEVLGCTDAMEYYNRKDFGRQGRANGRKIRPDEAKRKEMIIHKKNAQRRAQGKVR